VERTVERRARRQSSAGGGSRPCIRSAAPARGAGTAAAAAAAAARQLPKMAIRPARARSDEPLSRAAQPACIAAPTLDGDYNLALQSVVEVAATKCWTRDGASSQHALIDAPAPTQRWPRVGLSFFLHRHLSLTLSSLPPPSSAPNVAQAAKRGLGLRVRGRTLVGPFREQQRQVRRRGRRAQADSSARRRSAHAPAQRPPSRLSHRAARPAAAQRRTR
jgi:hypothetical protein